MKSKILSRRDLDFMLYEWLHIEKLLVRERFTDHSRETFDSFMDLSAEISETWFAPHNRLGDLKEPYLSSGEVVTIPEVQIALEKFAETGLLGATQDNSRGGYQIPSTISRACFMWFQAANISTSSYALLSMANANLLMEHGTEEQIDTYARPIFEGRYFGTMCLSEPQAGSALSEIRCRAVKTDDGNYRLFGNKMWISGGEHSISQNIVHLVLARVEGAPSGVKGLSLFIVPKYLIGEDESLRTRNDVVVAGLNHKMGNKGTVNTILNFGEGKHEPLGSPGAIGYLVGEENGGLACMFHMMNEARVGVGAGAVALGYTSYLHALEYSRGRLQGRSTVAVEDDSRQVPIIRHSDVRRMLLSSKCFVEGGLALILFAASLEDEMKTGESDVARAEASLLLDLLTPVVKSWPSQWCLAANDLAIQIHGGYGYASEYSVEQFYRDNRLNAIHEGTHGIQALDLLGRKVRLEDAAAFNLLIRRIKGTLSEKILGFDPELESLRIAVAQLELVTNTLRTQAEPRVGLSNATAYLEAFGHIVIGWLWLEQVMATGKNTEAFYEGKRLAAQYFFKYEFPRVSAQLELLGNFERMLLDFNDEVL